VPGSCPPLWHTIPTNLDPAAETLAKDSEWYKTLYHHNPEVHQGLPLHVESNIPLEFHDGLRKVCSKEASEETAKVLQGSLYDDGAYLNNDVPNCFAYTAKLMGNYNVDILWLNDGRFTAGTLERHLHLLQDALPDCRILQFPTTHVKTGSHCQQNNQMGGAIAIVNFKWKKLHCGRQPLH
jgi:hypothetical protein